VSEALLVPSPTPGAPARAPLLDGWGRQIKSLRVSVTDRCNFRCRYCMPAEGLEWLNREEILSFEEIQRLVALMAALGVSEIRLTGGEPLVRRDLPELVRLLAQTPGVDDLSLTTNGVLLDRARGTARRGRPAPDQRLARLAQPHPLRRDHPPRRARQSAPRA
jgi:pyruvate-formate lyase-activating enzyme